ncbi:MAG: hypothetical protein IT215_08080, partial [Chitinophagaceae bacterium]|nr:hypothetical protein [Chitinophagaceae bacterium]
MKKFIVIIIFFISADSFSQSNPLDTSYYNNRSIRSILYQSDFDITGYQVEVFYKKSDNIKMLGSRLADTVYEHQPKWPFISEIKSLNKTLIRLSRNYLPDSSCIEKHILTANQAPLTFSFSSIAIYFKREKISITYHYKNNKPIALYIGEETIFPHKKYKNIVNIISEKEIDFKHQEYLLTKSRK